MKWKDSNDTVELDAETGDDPKSGKSFSIKKDNGIYHSGQNSLQGKKIPVILVGGGVLILVVLVIWLIFGSGSNSNVQQINFLESRVKALENRLSSLEPLAGAASAAAEQEKSITELTLKPRRRRKTKPSRASIKRRLEHKRRQGAKKGMRRQITKADDSL